MMLLSGVYRRRCRSVNGITEMMGRLYKFFNGYFGHTKKVTQTEGVHHPMG
ncbi:hypothetical protein [Gordonia sp. N1V]|uniref:hypothetical protein n=1 Tax=Gordonia sp. N1V TaxID=3034163 RepID=UPI0023E1A9D8|nr:hypothetical protein [Gordonia sp. N1V]MDF3283215.1 hypothetical protein [Gordonia sp. N1V]